MRCSKSGSGHVLFLTTLLVAMCFAIALIADAQSPPMKSAPTAQEKGAKPAMEKKAQPPEQEAEKAKEYAVCSPEFPGEQIAEMMEFAEIVSKDLPGKLKPVLLKCDLSVNNQLLAFIEDLQQQIAEASFENEEQEKRFLQEKAKEVEIQVLLAQKPAKEAEVKKLVADIFEIRQQNMKDQLGEMEKDAAELKKRVEERQKLKDQIVERKAKEIVGEPLQTPAEKEAEKLAWD